MRNRLFVLVLVMGFGKMLLACDCMAISAENSFKKNDAVFIGIAEADADFKTTTMEIPFKVVVGFKGSSEKAVKVYQRTSDCSVSIKKDEAYLIYAGRDRGRVLQTDICRRSKELSARDIVEDLSAMPPQLNPAPVDGK